MMVSIIKFKSWRLLALTPDRAIFLFIHWQWSWHWCILNLFLSRLSSVDEIWIKKLDIYSYLTIPFFLQQISLSRVQ